MAKMGGFFFWFVVGTNRLGYAQKGPYDAIHVGAAARTIPPALLEQLASPGRMIIPVGSYSQRFVQVDKDAQGKVTQEDLFGVVVRALCCAPNVARRLISRFSWGAVCATY
jgi:protein-L-isoaspartate O-methyltransferase